MAKYKKTAEEKFQTKLKSLLMDVNVEQVGRRIKIKGKKIFKFTKSRITYDGYRYYSTRIDPFAESDYNVVIPINHETLKVFSSNLCNPPNGIRYVADLLKADTNIKQITIGAEKNSIVDGKVEITLELYNNILKVNREETQDKITRFKQRLAPIILQDMGVDLKLPELKRDYGLLLKEVLASGELGIKDLAQVIDKVNSGEDVKVVIEKQINKQVEWLIEQVEGIIELPKLSTPIVKQIGKDVFGYNKVDVKGPEQFMEKILTDYGQYTLFGVPALLNTDKYVINEKGLTRSQFDLILINHLGEIEVVELKRPDDQLLEIDKNRGKFYASKNLSVAISQSERYLSAVLRDNDENYKIKNKKLREFIIDEVGENIYVETVRPTALIIMGSYQKICADYNSLSEKFKNKMSKADYDYNSLQAYRELKDAHKHIKILTYSELLENARTRLELFKAEEE